MTVLLSGSGTDPLAPGFHRVPPGHLATTVTHLEMTGRPAPRPAPPVAAALTPVPSPGTDWYRDLFRHVGADWLWTSRLAMPQAELTAILGDPDVEIFAVRQGRRDEGLLELDFRAERAAELAFFGLSSTLQGGGAGRWLMNHALDRVFARVDRVTVHTCTLDHPAALPFYLRTGFRIVRQEVEILADPRLNGTLPADAGPHVPLAVSAAAG
ncbi:MAG: GNAT family N-acetyltransferase [Pseudomonadota bacterium]